jgi:uncharacterized Fe-S cluster-containing radical SAM superfamily protein
MIIKVRRRIIEHIDSLLRLLAANFRQLVFESNIVGFDKTLIQKFAPKLACSTPIPLKGIVFSKFIDEAMIVC